jgi:hypothetical protein
LSSSHRREGNPASAYSINKYSFSFVITKTNRRREKRAEEGKKKEQTCMRKTKYLRKKRRIPSLEAMDDINSTGGAIAAGAFLH